MSTRNTLVTPNSFAQTAFLLAGSAWIVNTQITGFFIRTSYCYEHRTRQNKSQSQISADSYMTRNTATTSQPKTRRSLETRCAVTYCLPCSKWPESNLHLFLSGSLVALVGGMEAAWQENAPEIKARAASPLSGFHSFGLHHLSLTGIGRLFDSWRYYRAILPQLLIDRLVDSWKKVRQRERVTALNSG